MMISVILQKGFQLLLHKQTIQAGTTNTLKKKIKIFLKTPTKHNTHQHKYQTRQHDTENLCTFHVTENPMYFSGYALRTT